MCQTWEEHPPDMRNKRTKYNNSNAAVKYRNSNREFIAAQARIRYKETDGFDDKLKKLRKFGLTQEQYEQMIVDQNNSCAICGRHQDEFKKFIIDRPLP